MKFFIAFTFLVVTTCAEVILPAEQIKDNEGFIYTIDNPEKPAEVLTQIKIETTPSPDPLALASASASAAQARQQREIILGTHTSPLLVHSVLPRYVLFDQEQQLPVYPFYILPYRNLGQQQQQQQPQEKN